MGDDESLTPPITKITPTYADGTPIVHDDNRASIGGYLHEFDLWQVRTGNFIEYTELHGVVYKSMIAVECATTAIFYINRRGDPRSASDPAPPALQRLEDLNARRAAMTPPRNAIAPLAAILPRAHQAAAGCTARCELGGWATGKGWARCERVQDAARGEGSSIGMGRGAPGTSFHTASEKGPACSACQHADGTHVGVESQRNAAPGSMSGVRTRLGRRGVLWRSTWCMRRGRGGGWHEARPLRTYSG